MNTLRLSLAILFLAGLAAGQSKGATCNSQASLKIRVQSGFCKAWGRTDCSTHTKAVAVIEEQTIIAVAVGRCVKAKVDAAAVQIATAFAKVATSAVASVACRGKGFGCGFAISDGSAFATAYAQVIVRAVAAASNQGFDVTSVCTADLEAISQTFAKAVSTSQARVCAFDNASASRFESNVVSSLAIAVASAFIKATASVCEVPKVTSSCEVDGGAGSVKLGGVSKKTNSGSSVNVGPGTGGASTSGSSTGSGQSEQLHECQLSGPVFSCCFHGICAPGTSAKPPSGNVAKKLYYPAPLANPLCFCY